VAAPWPLAPSPKSSSRRFDCCTFEKIEPGAFYYLPVS
jgi:hypothetical protein